MPYIHPHLYPRFQAKKVKEVLSANTNIPVHIEGVHDDIDLSTQVGW